jgi:hypothetical protein
MHCFSGFEVRARMIFSLSNPGRSCECRIKTRRVPEVLILFGNAYRESSEKIKDLLIL